MRRLLELAIGTMARVLSFIGWLLVLIIAAIPIALVIAPIHILLQVFHVCCGDFVGFLQKGVNLPRHCAAKMIS